jgi:hypothetical protein
LGSHWYEIVAGIGFVISAIAFSRYGDDPRWFSSMCAVGIVMNFLMNLQLLEDKNLGVWIGTSMFALGQSFGALSTLLSARYADARSKALRLTLGRPRRMIGVFTIPAKLPVFYGYATSGNWYFGFIIFIWIVGDVLVSRSSASEPAAAE